MPFRKELYLKPYIRVRCQVYTYIGLGFSIRLLQNYDTRPGVRVWFNLCSGSKLKLSGFKANNRLVFFCLVIAMLGDLVGFYL